MFVLCALSLPEDLLCTLLFCECLQCLHLLLNWSSMILVPVPFGLGHDSLDNVLVKTLDGIDSITFPRFGFVLLPVYMLFGLFFSLTQTHTPLCSTYTSILIHIRVGHLFDTSIFMCGTHEKTFLFSYFLFTLDMVRWLP